MKFDWSMVKGVKSHSDADAPPPPPAAAPRFAIPEGSYPVSVDAGVPLLDFITWCVPDDRSRDLGAIARLYDSLEPEETAAVPRTPR